MPEPRHVAIRDARWYERGVEGVEVDVVIDGGIVAAVGPGVARDAGERFTLIEANGAVLTPGFFDLHCHLRVPGQEDKETITSGTAAAAAGGFTRVLAMANTAPPVDDAETLALALRAEHGAPIRVFQAAAVTMGLEGREVTPMELLAQLGAVAFTDDGQHRYDASIAGRAMDRADALGRPLMVHAQDTAGCGQGQADPSVADTLGVQAWPCECETNVVRDLVAACRATEGRLHVQHVSCAATVDLVREAKAEGLRVTAEVTPHHLCLTSDIAVDGMVPPSLAKVNPPLRPEADRRALVEALRDGTIDAIATDHAPHDAASKQVPFAAASFGFSGLEVALGLCLRLVRSGELRMGRLVEALTDGPWRCFGQQALVGTRPGLRPAEAADLVLFDPDAEWKVDPGRLVSRGHNTPLGGTTLPGRVLLTIARGHVVHSAMEAVHA